VTLERYKGRKVGEGRGKEDGVTVEVCKKLR
jgi:hypothetical protein